MQGFQGALESGWQHPNCPGHQVPGELVLLPETLVLLPETLTA